MRGCFTLIFLIHFYVFYLIFFFFMEELTNLNPQAEEFIALY